MDPPGPNPSPLRNIRVIELAEALAGPYCAMLLGDLGADVIKIERPGIGDQSRAWGPPFVGGESAYYLSANRNKRSLELDIKQPADQAMLKRLVRTSDVFLTNIPRLASMRRAGIDPPALRAENPALIYATISGYGHTGPRAGQPGYDIIAQGEAGLMAMTGEPAGEPMRFPTPMADISAGLYCLIGILSALYGRDNRRDGSGKGQVLDVALLDSQVTWLANLAGNFLISGQKPRRIGNAHPSITPYQPIRARDKPFLLAVGTERQWQRLCGVIDAGELRQDPRFDSNTQRNAHRPELVAILEEAFARREAADWLRRLAEAGIPAGPIHLPDETLRDEQLIARGMVVELEHPLAGLVKSIACPVHLSETGPTYRRYPPRLGEHNDEIRAGLVV